MITILLMPIINLKLLFFYRIIDIVNLQIKNSFGGMLKIANLFGFLWPKTLITLSKKELLKSATEIQ